MVVDSSALLAILLHEPERPAFLDALLTAQPVLLSAANAVDAHPVRMARYAFRQYGKGRHPASLNYGDLFAYALSKVSGEPLLFKGEEFSKTAIVPAL